jgi:hypothetical protein
VPGNTFKELHHIPAMAIVETRNPEQVEEGKYFDINIGTIGV